MRARDAIEEWLEFVQKNTCTIIAARPPVATVIIHRSCSLSSWFSSLVSPDYSTFLVFHLLYEWAPVRVYLSSFEQDPRPEANIVIDHLLFSVLLRLFNTCSSSSLVRHTLSAAAGCCTGTRAKQWNSSTLNRPLALALNRTLASGSNPRQFGRCYRRANKYA